MATLPAKVPNDMDLNAQVTQLTETVNQLIDIIAVHQQYISDAAATYKSHPKNA